MISQSHVELMCIWNDVSHSSAISDFTRGNQLKDEGQAFVKTNQCCWHVIAYIVIY